MYLRRPSPELRPEPGGLAAADRAVVLLLYGHHKPFGTDGEVENAVGGHAALAEELQDRLAPTGPRNHHHIPPVPTTAKGGAVAQRGEFGAEALSGITAVFPIMIIMMAFGMLVGVGASVRFSLALGLKDMESAQRILGNAAVVA